MLTDTKKSNFFSCVLLVLLLCLTAFSQLSCKKNTDLEERSSLASTEEGEGEEKTSTPTAAPSPRTEVTITAPTPGVPALEETSQEDSPSDPRLDSQKDTESRSLSRQTTKERQDEREQDEEAEETTLKVLERDEKTILKAPERDEKTTLKALERNEETILKAPERNEGKPKEPVLGNLAAKKLPQGEKRNNPTREIELQQQSGWGLFSLISGLGEYLCVGASSFADEDNAEEVD